MPDLIAVCDEPASHMACPRGAGMELQLFVETLRHPHSQTDSKRESFANGSVGSSMIPLRKNLWRYLAYVQHSRIFLITVRRLLLDNGDHSSCAAALPQLCQVERRVGHQNGQPNVKLVHLKHDPSGRNLQFEFLHNLVISFSHLVQGSPHMYSKSS